MTHHAMLNARPTDLEVGRRGPLHINPTEDLAKQLRCDAGFITAPGRREGA